MNLPKALANLTESDAFTEFMDEISDAIVIESLMESRERYIEYYKGAMNGAKHNIFEVDDPEQDAFQISLRIQSIDMILDDYKCGHVPYDFANEE